MRRNALPVVLLAASLCLALSSGCAHEQAVAKSGYSEDAQAAYEEAVSALESKNFEQAILAFEQIRSKFPYSSYAALSELRIADAEFGRGRWLEAIDSYQAFVKFHPDHPQVDWATFRIGESHFRAIPSSFFLFPSASERDQTEVRAAKTSLTDFVSRFPKSEYLPRAKEELQEVMGLLARHELYAARFYASREHWAGAAGRYRYLLQNYPGSPYETDATLGLAEALAKLGEHDRAKELLDAVEAAHPHTEEGRKAREMQRMMEKAPNPPEKR
ncbi:outer membrane protein assembly factor BamD [Vulgatibacter incomptus]|nr:outer membrane protein assembly factor BamD [Vulgatibacter incomptus]